MNIIIQNSSDQPLYEQIYRQLKAMILSGELLEGDLLPSIRSLAKDLHISVITTKRAYDELERDGYIHTVAAKGCFVAKANMELIREENLKRIEAHMQSIAVLAKACRLSREDLLEMFYVLEDDEA